MTKQLSPYQDKIHKHILRDAPVQLQAAWSIPGWVGKSEADAEGERS